jgi:hypothetical protein
LLLPLPLTVADDVPRLRVSRIRGALSLSELARLLLPLVSVSSSASECSGLVYSGGGRLSCSGCRPRPAIGGGWSWVCM